MHSPDFQAVPRTDKVGSDTLEGPRFMAKHDSYKVHYTDVAAKQLVALHKGSPKAQTVPRLRKRLCNQQSFVFSGTGCSGTPCTVPTALLTICVTRDIIA